MKKKFLHKKGFTLVELMVVMTIMVILTVAAYTPFSYYQKKQKVVNSAKLISQTLSNSRNSAIYGFYSSSGNLDIGVLIKSGENNLKIYGFPFSEHIVNYANPDSKYFLKKIDLEPEVKITSPGGLVLYKAISGSGVYKNFTINSNKIDISVGFNGVMTGSLAKNIKYYTNTYISDVE